MMTKFNETLSHYRHRAEIQLNALLCKTNTASTHLNDAMRYSTLNAGKRLRPILVYATGSALGQSLEQLDLAAAAVECMHCYSLIHDDLPAMDNDALRRGKPTCHLAFDEATAILAGDALQALAFECLTDYQHISLSSQLRMIRVLATAAGKSGMVGGQSLDLQAEGNILSIPELEFIHTLKTGALFKASIALGALAADCQDEEIHSALGVFADRMGLAFQIQDDLLDHTGESLLLGKEAGQDIKQQKATYTTLFGENKTRARIQALTVAAISALEKIPNDTSLLKTLCLKLVDREA